MLSLMDLWNQNRYHHDYDQPILWLWRRHHDAQHDHNNRSALLASIIKVNYQDFRKSNLIFIHDLLICYLSYVINQYVVLLQITLSSKNNIQVYIHIARLSR